MSCAVWLLMGVSTGSIASTLCIVCMVVDGVSVVVMCMVSGGLAGSAGV